MPKCMDPHTLVSTMYNTADTGDLLTPLFISLKYFTSAESVSLPLDRWHHARRLKRDNITESTNPAGRIARRDAGLTNISSYMETTQLLSVLLSGIRNIESSYNI